MIGARVTSVEYYYGIGKKADNEKEGSGSIMRFESRFESG